MSPEAVNSFFSLCIGFAFAGMLASGYQAFARRPAGFGLLNEGVVAKAFAAVPFLVFAACGSAIRCPSGPRWGR